MIEFIAGDRLATLSSHQLFELNEQVEQIIEHTTGVQTVVQMEEMYRLLQKYDFVPKDRRKTPLNIKTYMHRKLESMLLSVSIGLREEFSILTI